LGHDPGVTDSALPLDALGPVFELCTERPLAVFDLETTGTDRLSDRIVEVAVVRFGKGGEVATLDRRVNPGVKIPRESTRVHGISDADVAGCPASTSAEATASASAAWAPTCSRPAKKRTAAPRSRGSRRK
jgi:hypothetical protein